MQGCIFLGNSSSENTQLSDELLRKGFASQFGECQPCPCLKITVDGPGEVPAGAAPQAREGIQRALIDTLLTPLDAPTHDGEEGSSKEELSTTEKKERFISQLQGSFLQIQKEGATSAPIDWRIERIAKLLHADQGVATFEVIDRGFLGGAHGFDTRTVLTFDLTSGKRVTLSDIVSEESQARFEEIVEREFRRVRKIPLERSLQDEGIFLSEKGTLPMTENIGIISAGLLVHYNPYEVAPYSFGPTQVIIPREALSGMLKSGAEGILR